MMKVRSPEAALAGGVSGLGGLVPSAVGC